MVENIFCFFYLNIDLLLLCYEIFDYLYHVDFLERCNMCHMFLEEKDIYIYIERETERESGTERDRDRETERQRDRALER